MKNKIITICVIMAAILSFMSFTAVLTLMNTKSDDVVTEAPELKSFKLIGNGSSVTNYGTYFYYEGMTWKEWLESDFNTSDGELNDEYSSDLISWQSYPLSGASGVYLDDNGDGMAGRPLDDLGQVKPTDVIEHSVYFFND